MIVYDVTSGESYQSVRRWNYEINSNLTQVSTILGKTLIIFIFIVF